ncbi:MAG: 1,4-dihydroxy-2-naphthoate polyprenyltransferase [Candidatus Hydrogenedentes bacterium]|nr:1,4-dihydroxy-2-naphthoate polyprenyltransferase [Candidatus Hydrogenedentota bacterium]
MEKPPLWKILYLTARPKTLGASISPVIIGTGIAIKDGGFHLLSAVCALVGGVMIQILVNYANDYFDYLKGADSEGRLGPIRSTTAGWLTPNQMRFLIGIITILCIIPGFYLVWRGGIPILIIGVVSIFLAYAYTAGPFPLAYFGLGDIFVLIFFGPIAVAGTYYVQALKWDISPIIAGLSPGLLSVAILTVNNYRDIESDCKTGKRTLAVRFGKNFAFAEYTISILVPIILVPLVLSIFVKKNFYILALAVLLFPGALLIKSMFRLKGSELNQLLGYTTKFLLLYGVLFSVLWQM